MGQLKGLHRDNQSQNEKITHLQAQIYDERSTTEARLAQEKASINQRVKGFLPQFGQLKEEALELSEELEEVKLELSKARGDQSTSKAMRSKLESKNCDLSAQCEDYEKKIVEALEGAELVAQNHVKKYPK